MRLAHPAAMQKLAGKLHPDARGGALGRAQGLAQIVAPVASGNGQRQHRSGHHHRLGEPLEGEAERRGGIGERVGPVRDDEGVETTVTLLDKAYHAVPVGRCRICAVDLRRHRANRHLRRHLAAAQQASRCNSRRRLRPERIRRRSQSCRWCLRYGSARWTRERTFDERPSGLPRAGSTNTRAEADCKRSRGA